MYIVNIYFLAERLESFICICIGIGAILFALWLILSVRVHFYNGMAYSLGVIALLQIGVGATVVIGTQSNITRVDTYVGSGDKAKLSEDEIPRMEEVMKRLVIYRYIALGALALGIALFIIFREPALFKGVGFGLTLQAIVLLLLDFFATQRGHDYLLYLRTLV